MQDAKFTPPLFPIGLGSWHIGDDPEAADHNAQTVRFALDHGVNVLDTAEMYGDGASETVVGRGMAGVDRDKVFLISKFYPWHASARDLPRALEGSLRRLNTDYLDLYLLHWPGQVPLAETIKTLQDLQRQGLIKQYGVSNFDAAAMQELFRVPGGSEVQYNEDLYHLGSRGIEYDLLPWQRQHGVRLIAYSPLAHDWQTRQKITGKETLRAVAKAHGATPFQIMLAWAIRDGQTIAIPESTNPDHVATNIAAAKITLTKQDLAALDHAFPGPTQPGALDVL
ncbi:aldo/keto reductase [Schleiferilactobacillus harbinensis]|uniref:aldo/keto reductase n=1 Tax=Schleiferilactobacillus harbinensis TaxID=304207 RepID=UPI001170B616|nr:aldo/keto reductase [Schleiferilactobacillus harbinensis]GEK04810.1 aldehyde reductase [Schleiferilactobacillus harbinensis]